MTDKVTMESYITTQVTKTTKCTTTKVINKEIEEWIKKDILFYQIKWPTIYIFSKTTADSRYKI